MVAGKIYFRTGQIDRFDDQRHFEQGDRLQVNKNTFKSKQTACGVLPLQGESLDRRSKRIRIQSYFVYRDLAVQDLGQFFLQHQFDYWRQCKKTDQGIENYYSGNTEDPFLVSAEGLNFLNETLWSFCFCHNDSILKRVLFLIVHLLITIQ